MSESVHKSLRHRLNGRGHSQQTNADAAIQAMELMRSCVQDAFDREIDVIVKKYIDVNKLQLCILQK